MSLNASEYGVAITLNFGINISAATSLAISFVRPDMTTFTGEAAAPTVDLITETGVFKANEYARYIFQEGDLNQSGEYLVRLVYLDAAPKRLVSDPVSFMVHP